MSGVKASEILICSETLRSRKFHIGWGCECEVAISGESSEATNRLSSALLVVDVALPFTNWIEETLCIIHNIIIKRIGLFDSRIFTWMIHLFFEWWTGKLKRDGITPWRSWTIWPVPPKSAYLKCWLQTEWLLAVNPSLLKATSHFFLRSLWETFKSVTM